MSVTRADVVAEARTWQGTPFHHQATLKGVGCDCGGLVRGTAIALDLFPGNWETLPDMAPFLGYSRSPDGVSIVACCNTFMDPISRDAMRPGDVILIAWDKNPQHVGILGDYVHGGLSIIHALGTADGRGRVIEQRLSADLMKRFVAAYSIRGVI